MIKKENNNINQKKQQDKIISKTKEKKKLISTINLKKIKLELLESKNKYLILLANFENYKKRNIRERKLELEYANEQIILEFLPIIDNLKHAIHIINNNKKINTLNTIISGIQIVIKQFKTTLEKFYIKELNTKSGDPFNHSLHEAIQEKASKTIKEKSIITVIQNGYTLKNKLIRPSKVIVAKKQKNSI